MQHDALELKVVMNSGEYTDPDGGTYTGYGLTAYRTDPFQRVFCVEDLSDDPEQVQNLIRLIVDNDVSLAHFEDLIEDFFVI